jgi:hypothetical protein
MTALVLFPSRIKFVNADGTLTPEAYRALQEIVSRTGGTLGSVGSDTYSDVVGDTSMTAVNVAYTDVTQPIEKNALLDIFTQPVTQEQTLPDIVQAGPIGINATITTALLVGKTVIVQDGIITGFQ